MPDLPRTRHEDAHTRYNIGVENQTVVIDGTIEYVRGWLHWIIDLAGTVERDPEGRIGHKRHGHKNWHYAKSSAKAKSGLVFWDGTAWCPVPSSWSSGMGTRLYGIAVWVEGGVTKTQSGSLAWPDPVPEWSEAALRDKDKDLARIEADVELYWTGTFELKRKDCTSKDPRCCRHPIRAEVRFVEVDEKTRFGIVLTENSARANAGAWPRSISANTASHEFGHHLGNPDEYPGATSVDPSVNGDGAVAGIDPNGLMGSGSTLRRRYYDSIRGQLTALINHELGKYFVYTVVPELSP